MIAVNHATFFFGNPDLHHGLLEVGSSRGPALNEGRRPVTDKLWGDLLLMMGFGSGLYWFFDGFRVYREYRVLADMPECRIRSLAMGLVEIHGTASGDETLTSPITHTPCFLYKLEIERWETDHGRGHWSHYWKDIRAVKFYVADTTGQVLVDPRGAEYDLMRRGIREIGHTGLWGLLRARHIQQKGGFEATDQELTEYVANLGMAPPSSVDLGTEDLARLTGVGTDGSERHLLGATVYQQTFRLLEPAAGTGRFRLTEYCIAPGELYDVTGTCIENLHPKNDGDRNLICKGENEPTFVISWREEREIENALRSKAALHIFGGAALAIACLYLFIVLVQLGWI